MNRLKPGFELIFDLPWHALCSDNRKYISRRFVLGNRYRKSKSLIGRIAAMAAHEQYWEVTDAHLEIIALVTPPDHRRRDLNFSKNLKDGITESGLIWKDDTQVRREVWDMAPEPDREQAGAIVAIRLYTRLSNKPT